MSTFLPGQPANQSSGLPYNSVPRGADRPVESNDVHGAWAYAQQFVEKRLKSPSTAKFPFGGARGVTPLGGGRYKVDSYVDAQNGFGATTRQHFHLVIKQLPGQWQLESLRFGER